MPEQTHAEMLLAKMEEKMNDLANSPTDPAVYAAIKAQYDVIKLLVNCVKP